jgi:hypothetical protein
LFLIASGGVVDKLMLAQRSLFASVLDPPRLRQQGRQPFSLWRSHPSCPGGEIWLTGTQLKKDRGLLARGPEILQSIIP